MYSSVDDVFDDIVDLAGVRVALYFPGERDLVDRAIVNLFRLSDDRIDFPKEQNKKKGKRFSGYSACHYRVYLKEEDLDQSNQRYSRARVEIQVASVLMHAWSEVEHDLEYKPMEGDLSEDEKAILDQINGMVLAGEIALESLQRAGKRRVTESGRKFGNHYELAAYLLERVDNLVDTPVDDSGVGRADILFELLCRLKIDTPEKLHQYLDSLHGNLEIRPLAEQVIETIVAQDETRFRVYQSILQESRKYHTENVSAEQNELYLQAGKFLESWNNLEHLVLKLPFYLGNQGGSPILQLTRELKRKDPTLVGELDALRRMRNDLVHRGVLSTGASVQYDTQYLKIAREQLDLIISEVRRQFSVSD